MPRVICELPNASLEISGVRFQKLEDGRFISDEIGDEATAMFLSIPGYVADEDEAAPVAAAPAPAKTKKQLAAEKAAAKVQTPAAAPAPVAEPEPAVEPEPVAAAPATDPVTPEDATGTAGNDVF